MVLPNSNDEFSMENKKAFIDAKSEATKDFIIVHDEWKCAL